VGSPLCTRGSAGHQFYEFGGFLFLLQPRAYVVSGFRFGLGLGQTFIRYIPGSSFGLSTPDAQFVLNHLHAGWDFNPCDLDQFHGYLRKLAVTALEAEQGAKVMRLLESLSNTQTSFRYPTGVMTIGLSSSGAGVLLRFLRKVGRRVRKTRRRRARKARRRRVRTARRRRMKPVDRKMQFGCRDSEYFIPCRQL
jgi:hypothetical protein